MKKSLKNRFYAFDAAKNAHFSPSEPFSYAYDDTWTCCIQHTSIHDIQSNTQSQYYYGFRFYSPDLGRWLSKDPILFAGGSPNLYTYCANNPINFVDPDGLKIRNNTGGPIRVKTETGNNDIRTLPDGVQSDFDTDGAIIGNVVIKHNSGVDITIKLGPDGNPLVYYDSFLDQQRDGWINILKPLKDKSLEPSGFYDYDDWIKRHTDWKDPERDKPCK